MKIKLEVELPDGKYCNTDMFGYGEYRKCKYFADYPFECGLFKDHVYIEADSNNTIGTKEVPHLRYLKCERCLKAIENGTTEEDKELQKYITYMENK